MAPSVSPYVTAANVVEQIILDTFPGVPVLHDRIHDSLGWDAALIGISPQRETASNDRNVLHTLLEVRYFDLWDKEIDPTQTVDPRIITAKGEEFRSACRRVGANVPATAETWFFHVEEITYPLDPTGNNTRFIATVRAWGQNSGLIETTA
jgi:hypothetical protein